ncbi:MAG: hypothetical protein A2Z69_00395 [Bacteroidetes bacterium RBG_13_44_24]|nr:MAG: hypothetical protein A2Z69_00395 [Bacteroidetes bacterium RBG_13_44_24]
MLLIVPSSQHLIRDGIFLSLMIKLSNTSWEKDEMPLYEYQCKRCGWKKEMMLPLLEWDKKIKCSLCGREMRKVIFPIITCLPHHQRKWGTSLYRRHEKGEVLKKGRPGYVPLMKRKGG